MNVLCLDIGNTHTHYGVLSGGAALARGQIATPLLDDPAEGLPALFARLAPEFRFAGISFCSVVPDATRRLLSVLANVPLPVWHLRHDACPGLGIHYPKPEEIGQDRLANCIGAQVLRGAPAIVIDAGTAVTFDILTHNGYEGGVIAPGVAVMTRYLREQTALLPVLDIADVTITSGIGKSTLDAMRLGCVVGFGGMIQALLDTVLTELEKQGIREPALLATGGTAGILPKALEARITHIPELTLLGLETAFLRVYGRGVVAQPVPAFRADLVRKYNIPGPRYTSYPTAVQFATDAPHDALLADARADFDHDAEISLYVHIPFCESLCWYCACNTITTTDHARSRAYLDDLAREIALWRKNFPRRPRAGQLHFGGGTPTFLSPDEIARLGTLLHDAFDFAPGAEISVEVDPRRLTPEHIAAYRAIGTTRASFGVQDFDAAAQRAINRIQTLEDTASAMQWAREQGFTSLNFDLIYGLPLQTPESLAHTLDEVVRLNPDRVAVFSYAHVPWMRPAQKIFERADNLPSPELKLELLQLVIERLTAAGYCNIGMDHFARPNDELAVAQRERRLHRNFQGYSTKAGLSLLGLGLTSISQTPNAFRQNEKTLATYRAKLDAGVLPIQRGALLSDEDKRRREIIMRIMCDCGLDYAALEKTLGVNIPKTYAAELAKLAPLAGDGLVALEQDGLRVLPAGRLFLRNIAMAFDAYWQPAAQHHSKTV